jgi:23S rRNA pseudouridine1911/1915/1917 synthase
MEEVLSVLPLDPMSTAWLAPDWEEEEQSDEIVREKHLLLDHIVERGQEPLRIDKYLLTKIGSLTRSKVQQGIDDGLVNINQKPIKANYKVRPGDHLLVYTYREPDITEILPENIPLDIVYEDDDLLLIHKPYNMVVHPGHGNYTGTVVNALSYYLGQQNPESTQLPRIGLVHRIDKDTTGLLVVGKSEKAINGLSEQFKDHTVERTYQALVWGDVEEDEGRIETYIGRHERLRKIFTVYDADDEKGKHAITHYRVLERLHYVTLVECRLETGRTHQIRVHMKHIGHTLFNDSTYGGDRILKGTVFSKYQQFVDNCFKLLPRQALHAKTLGFVHPITREKVFFESELPADMEAVLEKWRTYVKAKKPV